MIYVPDWSEVQKIGHWLHDERPFPLTEWIHYVKQWLSMIY